MTNEVSDDSIKKPVAEQVDWDKASPEQIDQIFKEWLKPLQDPELFLSLVELGLIYKCELMDSDTLRVTMTLTSPGCPMGDQIKMMIEQRAIEHEKVAECEVGVVWDPPWDPHEMASDECKDELGIW